jgi:hypothetical protein
MISTGMELRQIFDPEPTPPYGHPCLEKVLHLGRPQDRTFRSWEGNLVSSASHHSPFIILKLLVGLGGFRSKLLVLTLLIT